MSIPTWTSAEGGRGPILVLDDGQAAGYYFHQLTSTTISNGGFGGKGAAEGGLSIGMGGKGDFSAGEPGSNGLAIITFFSFLDIVGFLE